MKTSGFVTINIESATLQKLFSEAGVDFGILKWLEEVNADTCGLLECISKSAAKTIRAFLDHIIRSGGLDEYNDEKEDAENNDEIIPEANISSLMKMIDANTLLIDSEATTDIASGNAEADSGGPDFGYAHLKLQSGKGIYVEYSIRESYYGNDNASSPFYQWAKEHQLYDLRNERPGFIGGYDECLYFNPPYELVADSYDQVIKVSIDPE